MPQDRPRSLREALRQGGDLSGRMLWGAHAAVALSEIACGAGLDHALADLRGRSVLVATRDQHATALALIETDGVARRGVLCPPDLAPEHLPAVIAGADVDAIVTDRDRAQFDGLGVSLIVTCRLPIKSTDANIAAGRRTEWVLLTSGTTGAPKMVSHNLEGLTAAVKPAAAPDPNLVWGTFYDIRRYGGLQIFLRAVLGAGSMVFSSAGEPIADHLQRLRARGVTHLSGTPSQWRRVLMSPAARAIAPRYVRLSGEIADQAILDSLRACYPRSAIGHAYASTEAGVGFEVDDGLEGFPASFLEPRQGDVILKVAEGSLRIRSPGAGARYVGNGGAPLVGPDGFVDTGDVVERRGERYYFIGRRGGIINVGGLKVHPEEVEAVINRHRNVRMALVKARKNPFTGAVVVADIVLNDMRAGADAGQSPQALKDEILQGCRQFLPPHKVPAAIRFVPALDVTDAGKLVRNNA